MSKPPPPTRSLNILDRPLPKGKSEVSLSAFAYLFSELVQYSKERVPSVSELEDRLAECGYHIGERLLELLSHRDRACRRETRVLGMLTFIHSTLWRCAFGHAADSLEKGTEADDEYMISDKELLMNRFISVPRDLGNFNPGAFVAGIVHGALDASGFPARVTAHFVKVEGQSKPRTTILVKFDASVMEREERLGGGG